MRVDALEVAKNLGSVPLSLFIDVRRRIDDEDASWQAKEAFLALQVRDPGPVEKWWPELQDKDPWIRLTAAKILIALGERDPRITDVLLACLRLDDRLVRTTTFYLLGKHADTAPRVITALLEELPKDERWGEGPATALGKLGVASPEVIEALYAQIGAQETVRERHPASVALPHLASGQSEAVAKLRGRQGARFTDLPQSLKELLDSLPDSAYVAMMLAYITRGWDETSWTRWREVTALGGLPERDPMITEALLQRLREVAGDNLQEAVIHALIRRGDGSPVVIEALRERLADPASGVRRMATIALWHLQPVEDAQRPAIVDGLLSLVADDNLEVGSAAARMLLRLAPADARLRQAAQERLECLHGAETATMLRHGVEENPTGRGYEQGPRPRPLPEKTGILSKRLSTVRWR